MSSSGFNVLAEARIKESTAVVISEKEQDGEKIVLVAQRLDFEVDGHPRQMFIKNAIKTDKQGLIALRNAIQEAIEKL